MFFLVLFLFGLAVKLLLKSHGYASLEVVQAVVLEMNMIFLADGFFAGEISMPPNQVRMFLRQHCV